MLPEFLESTILSKFPNTTAIVNMRIDCLEVLLVGNDGVAFEEREVGGKTIVRGEAGKEYKVKINAYRDEMGNYPSPYLIAELWVDGAKMYGCLYLNLSNNATAVPIPFSFSGFLHGTTFTSFAFADSDVMIPSEPKNDSTSSPTLGSIRVVIHRAYQTEEFHQMSIDIVNKPTAVEKSGEEKKFWQQASLTTVMGVTHRTVLQAYSRMWRKCSNEPFAEFDLMYHSAPVWNFLQEHLTPRPIPASSSVNPTTVGSSEVPAIDLTAEDVPIVPVKHEVVDLIADAEVLRAVKRERKEIKKRRVLRKTKKARVKQFAESVSDAFTVILEIP